jgi:cytochrome c oxidase cbb3-type subunit 4
MDINDLRSAVTVISLLLFLGLVGWAWDRRRRAAFDEAARLPFLEEDAVSAGTRAQEGRTS